MDPLESRVSLVDAIKEDISLVAAGYGVAEIADAYKRLSTSFRALGICSLLIDLDAEGFVSHLTQSGFARRSFIRAMRRGGELDHCDLALSRGDAFFDSLAAGNVALSREIADLSLESWRSDWEYEDDFLYRLFVHRCVRIGTEAKTNLTSITDRFGTVTEGAMLEELRLMNALASRDEAAFASAIVDLMNKRDREARARLDRLLEADSEAAAQWPHAYICTEGLALLRIATAFGLAVPREIPLCPTDARLAARRDDCEDYFAGIERELALQAPQ